VILVFNIFLFQKRLVERNLGSVGGGGGSGSGNAAADVGVGSTVAFFVCYSFCRTFWYMYQGTTP
jgi:hypothetical protein